MSRTATSTTTSATNRQTSNPASQSQSQGQNQNHHERIAARAYEKWVQRGRPQQGTDMQDWLEAEAEVKAEQTRTGTTSSSTFRR